MGVSDRVRRLVPNNRFAHNVAVLAGGTGGAQLLMIMAAPLLTRLYSPEDFGLLAVFSGLLGVCSVVASLSYELAIPLPESEGEATHIAILSLLAVLCTSALTLSIVLCFGSNLAGLLDVPALDQYFWLLPVGMMFAGVYKVFNYVGIRAKRFPLIARTLIWQKVSTLLIQVAGFKFGGGALLFGNTLGRGMGSVSLGRVAFRQARNVHWSWRGVRDSAVRYREFPIYSTWSGLFNAAGQQLPPLMFATFFGVGAAGLYALAQRVLALPMAVVGKAIGDVFFADAAQAYREDSLGSLVHRTHTILSQIGMPPALVLMIVAPQIFALVFGPEWAEAGEFARWMAPWLYMVFVTSPLSNLFSVMNKQRQGLVFQSLLFLSRICAIAAGAWYGNLLAAVILFASASAICRIGLLVWFSQLAGNDAVMVFTTFARALAVSIICVAPLYIGSHFELSSRLYILAAATTMVLIGANYLRLLRHAY